MVPKDPESPLSLLGTDSREPSNVCWSLHHCRRRADWFSDLTHGVPPARLLHTPGLACGMEGGSH